MDFVHHITVMLNHRIPHRTEVTKLNFENNLRIQYSFIEVITVMYFFILSRSLDYLVLTTQVHTRL